MAGLAGNLAATVGFNGRLREADMDRAVFDSIEREIDDEVRARFPADVINQAVLLRHGQGGPVSSCSATGTRRPATALPR